MKAIPKTLEARRAVIPSSDRRLAWQTWLSTRPKRPCLAGSPPWTRRIEAVCSQHWSCLLHLLLTANVSLELAYTILRTLRTSSMAAIVDRLHPILHLDPVMFLPPELTFEIFSYLPPQCLLTASTISRAWRARALDSRLWKELYGQEGWAVERQEVRQFENAMAPAQPAPKVGSESRQAQVSPPAPALEQQQRQTGLFGGGSATFLSPKGNGSAMHSTGNSQPGTARPETPRVETRQTPTHPQEDEVMEDVGTQTSPSAIQSTGRQSWDLQSPHAVSPSSSKRQSQAFTSGPPVAPSLTIPASIGQRKLNWQYLYKQRRKLEDNWTLGRYVTFRLPHPDHQSEGHAECVYTLQYFGKYLVSGSRDKSLRIWDLDTKRLVRKPLYGHNGSVLCLQFDPSEDEDIIISGSSDTDVIAWRFSTGEKIKKIRHAHAESVLNLRFDKRYLITCSKDKTINVWNRSQLEARDDDFPSGASNPPSGGAVFPAHILSMAGTPSLGADARLNKATRHGPLPRFSLLMTLHGHNAAVNAIQVHGDQIVSASGDRTIKIWSLQSGACIMTIPGHSKGIACVQFDGRRIVSGSSDNTVKIFDRTTGAEVACLLGHQYLVRTVQAGFGDVRGSEEDEQAEAREVDRTYFKAKVTGQVDDGVLSRKGKVRNAGSKDPRQITAFGANLPPGGGGSRWGRIVSGSYDETVIIWKRDAEGKWVVGHRLRQAETARPTGNLTFAGPTNAPPTLPNQTNGTQGHTGPNGANALAGGTAGVLTAQQVHLQQQLLQATANNQLLQMTINHHAQNNPGQALTPQQLQAQLQAQQQAHAMMHNANNIHANHSHATVHGGNSRVFKLQFDARRVICCSQDPRIMGWDFANGDAGIAEASKFFQGLG